jgi:glycosyltransferase involved in cell wall biosynthesis
MTGISIAMATCNGAQYIGQQLESIANQTLLPDELIVSDDCSRDESLEIVERFAHHVPFPVRVCRNPQNLGFNRNFVRAMSQAKGDLIFLSDQDDIWFPEKIQRVADEFRRDPQVLAVIHDERIIDEETGNILDHTYFANERALGFANRELVSGNCTAIRREFLDILLPFPEGINYDYWIGWMADVLGCRLILAEPLQLYRRHAANSTRMLLAAKRGSPLSRLLRTVRRDSRPAWRETAAQYRMIAERIEASSAAIDRRLGDGRAASSLEKLSNEIRALEARIEVMSLPPVQRQIEVLRNWRRGTYRHFSGVKSAIRDMFQL